MIKAENVYDLLRVQKLQQQHKFVMEGLPVTLARSCTSCSTRTLVGISLADGKNLQSIHSNSWIENLLRRKQKQWHHVDEDLQMWYPSKSKVYLKFAVSRIHNKHDSIHSERGLSDVGSNDTFSHTIWSLAENIRKQIFSIFLRLFFKSAMLRFSLYSYLLENLGLEVRGQLGVNWQHG